MLPLRKGRAGRRALISCACALGAAILLVWIGSADADRTDDLRRWARSGGVPGDRIASLWTNNATADIEWLATLRNDGSPRVRRSAYGLLGRAFDRYPAAADRARVVETLVGAVDEPDAPSRRLAWRVLRGAGEDSFSPAARGVLLQALPRRGADPEFPWVLGAANLQEARDWLRARAQPELVAREQDAHRSWSRHPAWVSLLVLARLGDPTALQSCLDLFARFGDAHTRVTELLWPLAYTHQRAALLVVRGYLASDGKLRAEEPDAPGFAYAQYAAHAVVEAFPTENLPHRHVGGYHDNEVRAIVGWLDARIAR